MATQTALFGPVQNKSIISFLNTNMMLNNLGTRSKNYLKVLYAILF